jgi:hypothetical protein
VNHVSWLDTWDRGLVVPDSTAMQWKGRGLNQPTPFFLFLIQRKKAQYKEIGLSDETVAATLPMRP